MKQQETSIPFHSMIDVITNSSSEIFVYSKRSIKPAKDLLTELLKLNGSDKTCDDVFELSLKCTETAEIIEFYLDDIKDDLFNELDDEGQESYINDVLNGKRKEPDWWDEYEINYHASNKLVIKSKDAKYTHLIDLLIELMYSPEWYEHGN